MIIRQNNPAIDAQELEERVRTEVAEIRLTQTTNPRSDQRLWLEVRFDSARGRHARILELLDRAAARSAPREELPPRLASAIAFMPGIGRLLLGAFNYLFKQQREFDVELLAAVRDLASVQHAFGDYLALLGEEVCAHPDPSPESRK